MALEASGAPWLAFLDDDQHVARDWFLEARRAINETSADALFGAIAPQFEDGAQPTSAAQKLFTRNLNALEGSALYAFGPHKTRGAALTPGNALLRASALAQARFDPAFGLAGGEDFDLFCRLQRAGRRFAWRPSLRGFEFVPAARCEPAYLRRRDRRPQSLAAAGALAAARQGAGAGAVARAGRDRPGAARRRGARRSLVSAGRRRRQAVARPPAPALS
ncbi:MAG: hypothetical protein KGM15_02335 [Pseudomonadota bacterium]|nr:hypothetical protein [Pseudomonadota bacterium]